MPPPRPHLDRSATRCADAHRERSFRHGCLSRAGTPPVLREDRARPVGTGLVVKSGDVWENFPVSGNSLQICTVICIIVTHWVVVFWTNP